MNDATARKLSRLRAAAEITAAELAEFESAEALAISRLDRAVAAVPRDADREDDLADEVADARDEVAAAELRAERARLSLAQAEAEAEAAAEVGPRHREASRAREARENGVSMLTLPRRALCGARSEDPAAYVASTPEGARQVTCPGCLAVIPPPRPAGA